MRRLARNTTRNSRFAVPYCSPHFCFRTPTTRRFSSTSHQPTFQKLRECVQQRNDSSQAAQNAALKYQECWNCDHSIDKTPDERELFCAVCDVLQPPKDDPDYFNIMNLPTKYDIDTEVLTKRYITLQRMLHPDRFHTKSEAEKKFSEAHSTAVNDAYKTLRSPLLRARYLLQKYNIDLAEDEMVMDTEFLMEIMELREKLLSASDTELTEARVVNREKINQLAKEIGAAFGKNDLTTASDLTKKLVYYVRMEEEINKRVPVDR